MAWGSTQEAAALFSVIHLFPHSKLQEVGLCWVDPKSQIPTSWGFQSGSLPPLGASPDGLIRHRAVATAPASAESSHPVPNDSLGQTSSLGSCQSPDQTHAQSSNTAVQQPLMGLLSTHNSAEPLSTSSNAGSQPATAQRAQQPSMQSVQTRDPALAEFEVLLAKVEDSSKNLASNPVHNPSSSYIAPQTHATQAAPQLQPHVSSTSAAAATPFSSVTQPQEPVMARHSAQSSAAAPAATAHAHSSGAACSAHSSEAAGNAAPPEQAGCQEEWLEAVEIKNVCPFREARDVSSNGKSRRLYRLSDPGPYSRVWPLNPQCNHGLQVFSAVCCRMRCCGIHAACPHSLGLYCIVRKRQICVLAATCWCWACFVMHACF